MKWGILFRWQSWWIGAHWSDYNKRLCVNVVPFITIWISAADGKVPEQGLDIYRSDKYQTWEDLYLKEPERVFTGIRKLSNEEFDELRNKITFLIESGAAPHEATLELKTLVSQFLEAQKE